MSDHDIIDRAALDELRQATGNDQAFLAELIDTYLSDAVGLLAAMHRAVAEGSAEQLRYAAHSLKSSSATLGARALAELCLAVERQARSGVLDDAAEQVLSIQRAFADAERELRALRPVS